MTKGWVVLWDPATKKELGGLGRAAAERVREAVHSKLAVDPYGGVRLLASSKVPIWRLRVGSYRVIYTVNASRVTVLVLRVGHRSSVYRDLKKTLRQLADP